MSICKSTYHHITCELHFLSVHLVLIENLTSWKVQFFILIISTAYCLVRWATACCFERKLSKHVYIQPWPDIGRTELLSYQLEIPARCCVCECVFASGFSQRRSWEAKGVSGEMIERGGEEERPREEEWEGVGESWWDAAESCLFVLKQIYPQLYQDWQNKRTGNNLPQDT